MLLKNFGVTRHGRVVFYDYDELCLLTDCRFRDAAGAPATRTRRWRPSRGSTWASTTSSPRSSALPRASTGALRDVFLAAHGDLLGTEFWRAMQALHAAGEVMDIFPYRPERRLREGH